ncbi:MAG: tetratricopeptide repeat protein, partial [Sphingomonadales bacterium]
MNRSPGSVDTVSALANLLRQRNELDEAISQYTRAIDMAGDNENARHWVLYYARGLAFDQNEEWGRAEADFLKALALSPNQPDVLNYLGYSWVERGENMDRAHAMLEEAVVQRPNDGYIVDSLGWSHYRRGDLEQATEYLERAVLLRPENPTINEHLGDVYWMNGRRIEARFQWTHALSLGVDADQDRILRRKIADGLIDGNGIGAAFNDRDGG